MSDSHTKPLGQLQRHLVLIDTKNSESLVF